MIDGFEEIVTQSDPKVQVLARRARALIQEIMPEVVEVSWPRQRIIGYGVGPKKMSEQFCYIAVYKRHVNLGFYYGADLPDPANLLDGTGKLLRHVKITKPYQLESQPLYQLLEAASRYLPRLKP